MEFRGYKIVQKRFESFVEGAVQIGAKTVYDIVWAWRGLLSTYPIVYAGDPPFEWASEKQRRYVMWAMRTGVLRVPYHRTGHYGWNWRVRRDKTIKPSDGVGYQVYNAMEYAKFVSGGTDEAEEELQFSIHRGRWLALRDALEGMAEEVHDTIDQNIAESARREGL